MKLEDEAEIWEHLGKVFVLAHLNALTETVEALASRLGISEIEGRSVDEFFHRRKHDFSEQLVADLADTNPTFASQIKAAWEKLDRQQGGS